MKGNEMGDSFAAVYSGLADQIMKKRGIHQKKRGFIYGHNFWIAGAAGGFGWFGRALRRLLLFGFRGAVFVDPSA